jgi:hypothetical protein
MSHKQFVFGYKAGPLGYLIAIPKAMRILMAYKIRDSRLQSLLFKTACTLLALVGVGICVFNLMPLLFAAGVVAQVACFFALLLWLGAGDIFLKFALEDESFFQLATNCRALSFFEDSELSSLESGN